MSDPGFTSTSTPARKPKRPRSPRNRQVGPSKRRTRYIADNEIRCDGPGCDRFVAATYATPWQKKFFCSDQCDWAYYNRHYVIGTCLYCGGPIKGTPAKALVRKYCCNQHYELDLDQKTIGHTGIFRPIIEEYLAGDAKSRYTSLPTVRVSLVRFFTFLVEDEHVARLEDIRSSTITRFIAYQRARGMMTGNYIGHLSTFFKCLQAVDRIASNPVVPYVHSQKGRPAEHRDYTETEMAEIWKVVEQSGDTVLQLAWSLGEECGLRIGEVCNLRLSDLDAAAQTAFVRLPTKNKRTRTVPFSNKVSKYLRLWLAKRDPNCRHDHVLHGYQLGRFKTSTLDKRFSDLVANAPEPARSFVFHRLRHSWATRLLNNGMEISVLKELGGWVSWNSMQRYVRVLTTTRDRQYQAAYEKMQQQQEQPAQTTMSLADFAKLNAGSAATPDSARG